MTISKILFSTLAVSALALAAPASAKIATGSNVADMTVTESNGVQHNLSDFAGKKVVLEWTNEGCPYVKKHYNCLLYTSPSPRDQRGSRMPSSA